MKRLLVLLSLLFSSFTYADTINLHWLNADGSTYQNSTCVIDSDLILPATPPTKYGYTFTGWKMSNYYIPIEYLESTGTQYIDTGLFIDDTYGFSVTSQKSQTGNIDSVVIGVKGSGDSRWAYNPGKACYLSWNTPETISGVDLNKLHTISMNFLNDRKRIVDGESKLNITSILSSSVHEYSVCIFAVKWGTETPNYFFSGKIYSVKISKGSQIIRDFIPVLDNNGTPCMFDKVEGKFYYNAGTGQFIAGPTL